MTKVRDIMKVLSSNAPLKPKRITLDLSEDGTYYNTRFYVDFIDKDKRTYEGYIECRSKIPNQIYDFDLVYDRDKDDEEVFKILIPEEMHDKHENMS